MTGLRAFDTRSAAFSDEPIQTYARLAGIFGILTIIAGGFGEAYVPSALIVAGDADATARNLLASEQLFRWGYAGYLVEAICDAVLTMLFWVLVRPVHRNLAMLMVVLRIISTCGFAAAEMLYFGAFSTLKSAAPLDALPPAQLNALAYSLLKVSSFGQALFSMFYGLASIIFGWLLYQARLIPRVLGAAMIIMGFAFTARTFLLVLAPSYASPYLLAIAGIVFPALTVWLLAKGVNAANYPRTLTPD